MAWISWYPGAGREPMAAVEPRPSGGRGGPAGDLVGGGWGSTGSKAWPPPTTRQTRRRGGRYVGILLAPIVGMLAITGLVTVLADRGLDEAGRGVSAPIIPTLVGRGSTTLGQPRAVSPVPALTPPTTARTRPAASPAAAPVSAPAAVHPASSSAMAAPAASAASGCALALAYLATHAKPGFAHYCRPGPINIGIAHAVSFTCMPGTRVGCPDGGPEIVIAAPACAASYQDEASNSYWDFSSGSVIAPGSVQNGRTWDPYGQCP